jgi:hypothetical protein
VSGVLDESRIGTVTGDAALVKLRGMKGVTLDVHMRLPESKGLAVAFEGGLDEHAPVEIFHYCEQHALTCVVELRSGGIKGVANYVLGELTDVSCGGDTRDIAVTNMIGWKDGTYRIVLPGVDLPAGVTYQAPKQRDDEARKAEEAHKAEEERKLADARKAAEAHRAAEAKRQAEEAARAEAEKKKAEAAKRAAEEAAEVAEEEKAAREAAAEEARARAEEQKAVAKKSASEAKAASSEAKPEEEEPKSKASSAPAALPKKSALPMILFVIIAIAAAAAAYMELMRK